jgi:predicted RNase H-like HicB family nuclease
MINCSWERKNGAETLLREYAANEALIASSGQCLNEAAILRVATLNRYPARVRASRDYFLGDERYFACIADFRGLLASGVTKKGALADLEAALVDWISLALRRGLGLPPSVHSKPRFVTRR